MKTCSKCKLKKPEADFYPLGNTGRRQGYCKKCGRAYMKGYKKENREKIATRQKSYRAENIERTAATTKIYRAENRERIAAYKKEYRAENREKASARQKIYRAENREETAATKKSYYVKNREEIAAQVRLNKYGITPEALKRLLVAQGGVCAICGGRGGKKGLCVDHDHDTDKVRGLLCQKCNFAIGLLKDSSAVAQLATNYLKQHGK